MGTLGNDGSNPLIFDGRPESWPLFKKALHQLLDKEGYDWVVEGGDVFCAMLQAASAKVAKSTVTSGKGTVSTNVADYQKKDLQTAFTNASVSTSVRGKTPTTNHKDHVQDLFSYIFHIPVTLTDIGISLTRYTLCVPFTNTGRDKAPSARGKATSSRTRSRTP